VGKPQVVYQETVGKAARGQGEFHRELGEKMHYGFVALRLEPLERDKGLDVRFAVNSEEWPAAWLEAVEQGVRDSLQSGVLKGYPVQDVRVEVRELRRKEGESTPVGYHMAAVSAVKDALSNGGPLLLEPIMWVEITLPEEYVGEAISLLGSKGAKVENMFDRAGQKAVQALTPMRQLFGFSTELRSATQGRAGLMVKFARFDVLQ
jgi:elongation factor G